jgi:hypothetical protein
MSNCLIFCDFRQPRHVLNHLLYPLADFPVFYLLTGDVSFFFLVSE